MKPQGEAVSIRLDAETLAMINEHRKRLTDRVSPVRVTRADAHRDLIVRGFADARKEPQAHAGRSK